MAVWVGWLKPMPYPVSDLITTVQEFLDFTVIPSIPVLGKCGGISSYFLDLVFCFRESGL
jgi:hypothetical protein